MSNKRVHARVSFVVAVAILAAAFFGFQPKNAQALTNVATSGTGYRWYGMTASTDDTNKTAATGINDGNTATDFSLTTSGADDGSNKYEATGVIWGSNQDIVSVKFKNGTYDGNNNGVFAANFKLQYTTNGSTWFDTNWTFSPSYQYDTSSASGVEFTFSGSSISMRGVRVVGQVHLSGGNSWFANARELQALTDETAPTPTATPTGQTNLATVANGGVGYKWYGMTSSSADTNKTADVGINDGDDANFVSLNSEANDGSNKWEAAGVLWSTNKTINKISFIQGQYSDDKNGPFGANLKAQYTTDGSTWTDSGWSISPSYAYDNASESFKQFDFSGTNTSVKGVRIVGQVHVSASDGSWWARVNEVRAIGSGTAPPTATAFPTLTPFPTSTSTPLAGTPTATPQQTNTPLPQPNSTVQAERAIQSTEEAYSPIYNDFFVGSGTVTPSLPIRYNASNAGPDIVIWPIVQYDPSGDYAASRTYTDAVNFAYQALADMNEAMPSVHYVFSRAPIVYKATMPTRTVNGFLRRDYSFYNYMPDCYEMKTYFEIRQVWFFTDYTNRGGGHNLEWSTNGPYLNTESGNPWNEKQCGYQLAYFDFAWTASVSRGNVLHIQIHYMEELLSVAARLSGFTDVGCDTNQLYAAPTPQAFWRGSAAHVPGAQYLSAPQCATASRPLTYTGAFMGRPYTTTYPVGVTNTWTLSTTNYAGCGDAHHGPNVSWQLDSIGGAYNSANDYNYTDNQHKVRSGCVIANFWSPNPYLDYPLIDCTAWNCDFVQYGKWWLQRIPNYYTQTGEWTDRNGSAWTFARWVRLLFL